MPKPPPPPPPPMTLSDIRSPYAKAVIVSHLPNFVHKMRLHSFGANRRDRHPWRMIVNMSESWRDVKKLEESSTSHKQPRTVNYRYTSRINNVFNSMDVIVARTLRSTPLANKIHISSTDFDVHTFGFGDSAAIAQTLVYLRAKLSHLRSFWTDGGGFDQMRELGVDAQWMTRKLVSRLRVLRYWPMFERGSTPSFVVCAKLREVEVGGSVTTVAIFDQLGVHDRQLTHVKLGAEIYAIPTQVIANDRLTWLAMSMPMGRPNEVGVSMATQLLRWPSLTYLHLDGVFQNLPADLIKWSSLYVRCGPSLEVISWHRVVGFPEVWVGIAGVRNFVESVAMLLLALRSSSAPDRRLKVKVEGHARYLPYTLPEVDDALKSRFAHVVEGDTATVMIETCWTQGKTVGIEIVKGKLEKCGWI